MGEPARLLDEQPAAATSPKRPSYCPGAYLLDVDSRKTYRARCESDVEVQVRRDEVNGKWLERYVATGLCASCSRLERENRLDLAAAKSVEPGRPRASRRFDGE